MPHEESHPEVAPAPLRRRRGQFSLRELLGTIGGMSSLFSAIYWVPGLGAVLLLLFGWFIPAAAVLGVLILVQWPMIILAVRWSQAARKRMREERQAFLYVDSKRELR